MNKDLIQTHIREAVAKFGETLTLIGENSQAEAKQIAVEYKAGINRVVTKTATTVAVGVRLVTGSEEKAVVAGDRVTDVMLPTARVLCNFIDNGIGKTKVGK